jgi:basic membrane lipoprotein Med (substrate-binding protein (PBP1-ABC) superfamily)
MARDASRHRAGLALLLLFAVAGAGCGGRAARPGTTVSQPATSTVSSEALHIGVVGGVSFSATGAVADRGTLDQVAGDTLVLVPAGGVSDAALRLVARAHPASHFAVIGGSARGVRLRNVAGVLLRRDQAAYLAGFVLGLVAKAGGTQHPKVALVGPAADTLLGAFRHGVRVAFEGAKATGARSSENPAACKEAALAAVDEGAVAIVSSRGPCALGALSAAAEQHIVGQSLADFEVRGAIASAIVRAALQGVYYGREDLNYGVRSGAVGIVRLDPLIPTGVAVQARAVAQRLAEGLSPTG